MQCEKHNLDKVPFCLPCVLERAKAGTPANDDLAALVSTIESQTQQLVELKRLLVLVDRIASFDKDKTR